jgi:hypothetical protein
MGSQRSNSRWSQTLIAAAIAAACAAHVYAQQTDGPSVAAVVPSPDFWGAFAIWGSTGVDKSGHIFVGVTSNDDGSASAHLFELDPASWKYTDRGNVIAELERLGLRRPREKQMKIHSRIVIGADGLQYFASMDESGEAEDGSRLPTWGGHLWRRNLTGRWEHLAATPEALIAVANGGPFIYALGYFNHVLYQFDTRSKRIRSVTVGSVGGHVSRNFLADDRGHVFVPRVARSAAAAVTATLIEFDADLKEIGGQPLAEYFEAAPDDSHGIVGISPDGSGGWFFTTAKGRLYHEEPAGAGPSKVTDLGWMHPGGARYPSALFRGNDGTLYALAGPSHNASQTYEWITRSPNGRTGVAPFPFGAAKLLPANANLYGSMSQDSAGRLYVVGVMGYKPLVLQVTVPSVSAK